MNIEFTEPAFEEYLDAVDFYNLQSEGLGNKFITEIQKTLNIIKKYPKSYSPFTSNSRKAVVNVFPYNLIYAINQNKIVILAVAHQNRKPKYWIDK